MKHVFYVLLQLIWGAPQTLLGLLDIHDVTFVWVHGHTGHPYNERCDALATAFADSFPT